MSTQPEKDPKEPRDPAKGGFCGGKMEKMKEMMSRCAEFMPAMMARGKSAQDQPQGTDTPAGCCSGGEEPATHARGEE